MAVPKKKMSKSRVRMRRSHDHLKPVGVTICNVCANSCLPHHICKFCNTYNGRNIRATASEAADSNQD
ncbi:MAG: 50S ribosomal protein L32 [Holosporales bacterium]|nr:50S ribosomal protein L32 [Holosporales bacterium]